MYTYFAGVKCCCHFVWLLSWAKKNNGSQKCWLQHHCWYYCWWMKSCTTLICYCHKYPMIWKAHPPCHLFPRILSINKRVDREDKRHLCSHSVQNKQVNRQSVLAFSLSRPGPWDKKFKLDIFPTKHVIPESLKFGHWLSEFWKNTQTDDPNQHLPGTNQLHQQKIQKVLSPSLRGLVPQFGWFPNLKPDIP